MASHRPTIPLSAQGQNTLRAARGFCCNNRAQRYEGMGMDGQLATSPIGRWAGGNTAELVGCRTVFAYNRDRTERQMETSDEQALMAAYAAGDDRAFDALFDAFAPRLLAFLRRGFGDASVADDLLQITFQRLHASRATYRTGSPVRPWLFTIAARVRIDELRRRYRIPSMGSDEELDHVQGEDVAEPARDQEDRARMVREAVDSLPESQRTVVHLHRFEGLTFAQIAGVLGVKEGAVRVRAFRAYEVLRERLKPLVQAEVGP